MNIFATLGAQTLTTVILPQYIQGNNGAANSNRIPFVYRVRLSGLSVNTTYRYYNQIVISNDAATSNGAGNCIFPSMTGDFYRTTGPGLKTAGTYDSLTTDGTGSYEGWFISEPTGNATRFIPGKYVFMRLTLNDGAGGTLAAKLLTTTDSVRVIKLDPASSDSTGTGLRCTSSASPKDFVFLYDNAAGTGRPITGSFIESDGTANTTSNSYALFYSTSVDGINGAFGVVLPNALPNGIRRIERRSFANANLLGFSTDADGLWPSGANTINPTGGTTAIVLSSTDVQSATGIENTNSKPEVFALMQNYPNPFNPTTTIDYLLPVTSHVSMNVYDIIGQEVAMLVNEVNTAGYHSVHFNAFALSSGIYFYRITAGTFTQTKQMMLMK